MESVSNRTVINSREDLDAIEGSPLHAEFMGMLKGSIYRIEKDDVNKTWVAVKDSTLIKQFGFVLKDFPDAKAPDLPEWIPPPSKIPQVVSMRQARLALLNAGLLPLVTEAIGILEDTQGDAGKAASIEWEYAQEVRRDSALVTNIAKAISLTEDQLDSLFTEAAAL